MMNGATTRVAPFENPSRRCATLKLERLEYIYKLIRFTFLKYVPLVFLIFVNLIESISMV